MSAQSRKNFGYATLALIALGFVVAVVATNTWLRGVRIDLTENDLYTLGEGTQAVLDGIEEPINLYLFFSDEATATLPSGSCSGFSKPVAVEKSFVSRQRKSHDSYINTSKPRRREAARSRCH